MRNPPIAVLVLATTAVAVAGCAAPRMIAPDNVNTYYPNASARLGEAGVVVLRFSVGPDGKAQEPIRHDEPLISEPYNSQDNRAALRLIEGAEKYIRAATFDIRGLHKTQLAANFVFEVKPCGTLPHARGRDYAISLCRERAPVTPMPSPHCRLIDEQLRC